MGRTHIVPLELIEQRIYLVRGEKVMLSTDLAHLYQVAPRVLVQLSNATSIAFRETSCSS